MSTADSFREVINGYFESCQPPDGRAVSTQPDGAPVGGAAYFIDFGTYQVYRVEAGSLSAAERHIPHGNVTGISVPAAEATRLSLFATTSGGDTLFREVAVDLGLGSSVDLRFDYLLDPLQADQAVQVAANPTGTRHLADGLSFIGPEGIRLIHGLTKLAVARHPQPLSPTLPPANL